MNSKKNVCVQILDPLLYYLKLVHCLLTKLCNLSAEEEKRRERIHTGSHTFPLISCSQHILYEST